MEPIKLPTEWQRFGYTHRIVKHPPFSLLAGALHYLPAVRETQEVASQRNGLWELPRRSGSTILKWEQRGTHFGRL